MQVIIKRIEDIELNEEQKLEIVHEILRQKFGMPKLCRINEDNLQEGIELRGHYYWETVRKATIQDSMYFTVLGILLKN